MQAENHEPTVTFTIDGVAHTLPHPITGAQLNKLAQAQISWVVDGGPKPVLKCGDEEIPEVDANVVAVTEGQAFTITA